MPIPTPHQDEDKTKFMSRCMHEASTSPDRTNEQNVAICLGEWRKEHPGSKNMTRTALASFDEPGAGLLWQMFVRKAKAKDKTDREKDAAEAGETENDDSANGPHSGPRSPKNKKSADDNEDNADNDDEELELGDDDVEDPDDERDDEDDDEGADDELEIVDMLVYGDIHSETNEEDQTGVSSRLFAQALTKVPNAKRINLHINSCGGSVYDAIAIQNQLDQHPAKTVAFVDGLAASAASILAVGADQTVMRQNSFMMIHQAWAAAIGDRETMLKAAEQLARADDTIAGIYATKTKLSKEKVMGMMANETWMTSKEAVKLGFADQVKGKTTKAKKTAAKAFVFNSVVFDLSRFRKLPSALNRLKLGANEKTPLNLVSDPAVILDESRMTIDDLKTKNPELYQQIYSLGQSDGVQHEQNRLAQLDALLTPETQALVTKAKLEGKQATEIMAECFATVVSARNKVSVNGRAADARALNVIGADISDTQKIELTVQEQRAQAAAMIANAAPGRNGTSGSRTL